MDETGPHHPRPNEVTPAVESVEPMESLTPGVSADLQATLPPMADEMATMAALPPVAESVPKLVPGHEILSQLGRGGMGVVYKARQTKLNRVVALKMIRTGEYASQQELSRFQAEAQAVARVQHPGIVQVFEVGEHDGSPFMVMEFCAGGTLEKHLNGSLVAADQAARIVEQIARAVQAAHEKNIVHRDLKPSNVLLTEDGTLKVSDFGLAHIVDEQGQTQTGAILGTPSYMAPEQAHGERSKIGPASDIYSLGVILYRLLTGRVPFAGPEVMSTLGLICKRLPVPPREMVADVPRDLETICLKCLEKSQTDRYESAAALADDLGRFLRREPIRARPVGVLGQASRWARRNPQLAVLAAALFVGLLLIAAASIVVAERMRAQRDLAQKNEERAASAERAQALELGQSLLAQAEALRTRIQAGRRLESLRLVSRAAELFHQHAPDDVDRKRELRTAALACLPHADLRPDSTFELTSVRSITYDYALERFAVVDQRGRATVRTFDEPARVDEVPDIDIPHFFTQLGFNRDGSHLVLNYMVNQGGYRGVVWHVRERRVLFTLPGSIFPLGFHPNDRWVCHAPAGGGLQFVDAESGRVMRTFLEKGLIVDARFSPDGRRLAVAAHARNIEIRDVETGRVEQEIPVKLAAVALAWSHDSRFVAAGNDEGRILVWDTRRNAAQAQLDGHTHQLVLCEFLEESYVLASTATDVTVRLWDAVTGRPMLALPGVNMKWARRRGLAVFGGRTVTRFTFVPGDGAFGFPGMVGNRTTNRADADLRGLDCHPTEMILATGAPEGVRLLDASTGSELGFVPAGSVDSVLFSRDGKALFTYGGGGIFRWPLRKSQVSDGTTTWEIGPPSERFYLIEGPFQRFAWVGGQESLAAVENKAVENKFARLFLIDPDRAERAISLEDKPCQLSNVAVSADGKWLAAGVWGGETILVWRLPTRRLAAQLRIGKAPGMLRSTVRFSPDGRTLACLALSGPESLARCWRVGDWEPLWSAPCTEDAAFAPPCFSPDGRLVAIGTSAMRLTLFDARSGVSVADLPRDEPLAPTPFAFAADGRTLVLGTRTGQLELWDLSHVGRSLRDLGLELPTDSVLPAEPEEPQKSSRVQVIVRGALVDEPARRIAEMRAAQHAADANPLDPEAAFRIGRLHAHARFHPHDERSLEQATRLKKDHPEAHYRLAEVYANQSKWEPALRSLAQHLTLRPDDQEPRLLAAQIANRLKRWDEGIAHATHLLGRQPDHAAALWERAQALRERERFQDALADLERLIDDEPYCPEFYFARAACLDRLGAAERATADRERGRRLAHSANLELPTGPDRP